MSDHLSDETLLLLQEGELSERVLQRAEAHLRACPSCRARQASLLAMDETITEAMQDVRPVVCASEAATGSEAARDRLLSALADRSHPQPSRGWFGAWLQLRLLLRVGTVIALLVLAMTWRQAYRPLQDRMGAFEETGPEPNHALTPGAATAVELSQLCSLSDNDLDPAVSPQKQRAVFQAYGMDEKVARAYQVDYLINPQLGGNDDMENLWPEPYHATVWNATAKDALETKLHGMVCSRQITLEEAQHDLSTDWIAAYKKYFHTQRPVRNVASVVEADLP